MTVAEGPLAPRVSRVVPGLLGVGGVAAGAWLLARWLGTRLPMAPDAVVIALIAGLLVRACWHPPASWAPGLTLAGRRFLEVAIILIGCSTDLRVMARGGVWLALSVVAVTSVALGAGLLIGRWMGLSRSHALLVASGNAICGNSAIAAVATVIKAPAREVASSIAYTAILSIGLVLVLPVFSAFIGLTELQYGAMAGMTVYAVPQVLAATYPVSARAGEIGTLVKLMRVLLLMPWLAFLSMWERRHGHVPGQRRGFAEGALPPYLLAFIGLALLRTAGLVPDALVPHARFGSHALTTIAMAALGLSVEPASLRAVGWRTAGAATVALLVLCAVALLVAMRWPTG